MRLNLVRCDGCGREVNDADGELADWQTLTLDKYRRAEPVQWAQAAINNISAQQMPALSPTLKTRDLCTVCSRAADPAKWPREGPKGGR